MSRRTSRFDRQAYKKRLREETEYHTQKSGREKGFYSCLKDDLSDDIKFFEVKEKKYLMDIIPYKVGENDPRLKEGDETFMLHFFQHVKVGPKNKTFLCMQETYGKECPICDHISYLQREKGLDGKEINEMGLWPKHRNLFNVVVYDKDYDENEVVVLEIADFCMGKHLKELAVDRTGEPIFYADIGKEGKTISFKREGTGPKNTRYLGHHFENRDYELSEELLDKAYSLDELLHIPTYDEVKEEFFGGEEEEESSEDEPRRSRRGDDYEEEEEVQEQEEDCLGKDFDQLAECEKCEDYKECEEEYKKNNPPKEKLKRRRRRT